ncbi:hypothetical protein [Pyrobaculum neutrophilum]|uniref:Uncharacterized protein n=1 Tax=Pyrobaculum neutrophilum (strain DSM 2338 / JCM 9278 / NBRC 100436 / V24Sta) TaxID=444157 RepID=B1YDJ6_PYRNV|nr:hypothetical protein [Pyrobaculum neutrophilum]ACB39859.1 conserved hypothetical protein [Pyrobaculum neutrophilum V24Sta]
MEHRVVFIFRKCPPSHLLKLRWWGYDVASLEACPDVETVSDLGRYIRGRFVIVVGDRELAEELGVAYAAVEEVERFLAWLSRELPPAFKPYLQ